MSNQIAGGWTTFSSDISKDAMSVFAQATKGLLGVNYTPVAVASQVVNGTNYAFFSNAKAAHPGAVNSAAMVNIYAPLQGDPHITAITPINQ